MSYMQFGPSNECNTGSARSRNGLARRGCTETLRSRSLVVVPHIDRKLTC